MKVAQPRIVAYDNKWMTVEGKPIVEKRWKVDGLYIDGMRVRKFFPQKKDAEKWLQEKLDQKDREGFAGLKVSDDLRIMAARCAEDLKPYGVSLRDAVNHYISHRKAIDRSCTIELLITEFIEAKEKDGARPAYMRDLRGRLTPFSKAFGSKMTAEISPRLLDDWLRELSGKGVTRNNTRRVLGVLFSYALNRGYTAENPILKTSRAKEDSAPPEIFTVKELRALLEATLNTASDLLPSFVLGAFAGLRPTEIERLSWSDINLTERFITISAKKSKTATRRIVKIEENLALWLAPYVRKSGDVLPANHRKMRLACMKAAKIKEWPQDVLRHCFGSYHLAEFKDASRTALEMGHAGQKVLHSNYKELVSPKEATAYWQIIPTCEVANIIPFKKVAS